jgi:hypothetical protein
MLLSANGLLLAGAVIVLISEEHARTLLREENQWLRQRLAEFVEENASLSNHLAQIPIPAVPRTPAPAVVSEPAKGMSATNLIALVLQGESVPPLTAAQVNGYLDQNHRSAASLLAAYRTTKDRALLREAMENYPGDPLVAYQAVLSDEDASPAERREWLDAFKKAAPDNAMADYLSAREYFRSGQTDEAVQELVAASGLPGFSDYTLERLQGDEEAYRAAGYSQTEAGIGALWDEIWAGGVQQTIQVKGLAQDMVALAASYRDAGDASSAQALLQMVIGLGQQLDAQSGGPNGLGCGVLGIAIERMAFSAMDPSSAYGDGTVQQQLDLLTQQRASITDFVRHSGPLYPQMTEDDWLTFCERHVSLGEQNAIGWMLNKYGQK